jgi:chromosomal replication initiator protein
VETRVDVNAAALWEEVSSRLQARVNEAAWSAWFATATPQRMDARTLEVGVANEFTRAWIEGHFGSLVAAAAREAAGGPLDVHFRVGAPVSASEPDLEVERSPIVRPPAQPVLGRPSDPQTLNPKYTFDHFVMGSSNRFAHAAALAVAEAPAQAYNPLFIYGATGLGKTHLLQAIAHYIRQQAPNLRPRYVTSESFMNDFISDLQDKRLEQFKSRYRAYGVLLVDDIQFFGGKERIQEEFFHTFNSLYEAGGQIVLSSDRPPRDIPKLEERLRSRFEWGLITDIQPPDLETRIAILRKKAERERIRIQNPAVMAAIAERIQTNIRELEGAFTRVVAYASLNGTAITEDLVRDILRDQFPEGARPVTSEQIQKVVADAFGVTITDLRGDRRTQQFVYPRQIAMYLCRELTDLSLPKIGERFGGRDHTTVHYAEAKITRLLREDRQAYNLVQELTTRIRRV